MKSRRFLVLAEISNFIMIYLLAATAGEIWDMVYKRPFSPILPVGILLMIAFSYLLRMAFNTKAFFFNIFFVYAFLHAIPLLLIIFLPFDFIYKLFLFGVFMVFLVTDMKNYFDARGEGFTYIGIIFVIVPALAYLFADVFDFTFAMKFFFVTGVLYVISYYFRLFFENAYFLSIERKKNEKMPLEEMLKNDSKLAIPFIIFSFVVMVVTKIEAFDRVTLFLYLKFARFLGFLFTKITELADYLYQLFFGDAEDVDLKLNMDELYAADNASSEFNIFSAVLFVILAAIVIFVLVRIIISIVKSLIVKKEIQTTTIEDEGMIEIREKIVRKKNVKKENLSKIRKQYKKAVMRNIKKGYELKKYQTPKERAEDIHKLMNEDIYELNALYEKERYGQVND